MVSSGGTAYFTMLWSSLSYHYFFTSIAVRSAQSSWLFKLFDKPRILDRNEKSVMPLATKPSYSFKVANQAQ